MLKGAGQVNLNIKETYNKSDDGLYTIGRNTNSVHIINTTKITAGITLTNYKIFGTA